MEGFDYDLEKDFRYNYITVDLHNQLKYSTDFNLQGLQVNLLCGYNFRNKKRWIVITDKSGYTLLSQTFLKFGKRCELGFEANVKNLNYYVTLKNKKPSKFYSDDYDYLYWSNDFELCFVGYEQSLQDRINHNHRVLSVGN